MRSTTPKRLRLCAGINDKPQVAHSAANASASAASATTAADRAVAAVSALASGLGTSK